MIEKFALALTVGMETFRFSSLIFCISDLCFLAYTMALAGPTCHFFILISLWMNVSRQYLFYYYLLLFVIILKYFELCLCYAFECLHTLNCIIACLIETGTFATHVLIADAT